MTTPKFIDRPNLVQTSLYGYDRNKKVQVNNLRGMPIVVFRPDEVKNSISDDKFSQKSNTTRSAHNETKSYPSYAHFHHQYTCQKPGQHAPSLPPTAHDRNYQFRKPVKPFPPLEFQNDLQNVKRLFDKLAITPHSSCAASSSSSSSYSNISSEITLLQLNPAFSPVNQKPSKNLASSCCSSISQSDYSSRASVNNEDNSFMISSPQDNLSSTPTSFLTDTVSDSDFSVCHSSDETEAVEHSNETEKESITKNVMKKVHTCPDEVQCQIFRSGNCIDEMHERKGVLQWYDDLIQWRHDILTKKRFGPPRCPPPPLTVTMIGASRAQRANPFSRLGNVHPFAMEMMDHARTRIEARRVQNLVPSELPLPAPHEFMSNAKCMEPHLFIEYCYQLTAAAYIDTGMNPPHRRPLLPPPIDPIPDQSSRESVCSSASDLSSDGEYSDDSEDTKRERLRQKIERHKRRERRLQQIFRRRAAESRLLEEIDEEE